MAALAVAGMYMIPAFASGGALLALDLVTPPRIKVPSGVWGLGPDLPRRVPLGVPLAWLSQVLGGPLTVKLFLFGLLVVGFLGAARLLPSPRSGLTAVMAGTLYTLNPFVATRLAGGHWNVLAAWAVLPFAVPVLLSSRDMSRTYLAALLLGLTGFVGGTFAYFAAVPRLLEDRGRRAVQILAVVTLAQAPWLAPSLAVTLGSSASPAGSVEFPTRIEGPAGFARLAIGEGFWRAGSELGVQGWLGSAAGVALVVCAIAGHRRVDGPPFQRRLLGLALVGFVVVVSSGVPVARDAYSYLMKGPFGVLRESHRAFALALLWLAPAASAFLGAFRRPSLRRASVVVVAAVTVTVTWPGLWGAGGRLRPVYYPASWVTAKEMVDRSGGTVLALPWHQFFDVGFASGRRVLNPLPDFFLADVISSSDPELGGRAREVGDPREARAEVLVSRIREGAHVSAELHDLGVRWVVLAKEVDWRSYSGLREDRGLRLAVRSPEMDLFSVESPRSPFPATDPRIRWLVGPVGRVEGEGPVTMHRSWQSGWMRGLSSAQQSSDGQVSFPSGAATVWYWPALAVLASYSVAVLAAMVALQSLFGRRDRVTVGHTPSIRSRA